MSLNKKDLNKLCQLAHLSLSDDKKEAFASQLDDVLGYMQTLQGLNLSDVSTQDDVLIDTQELREDTITKNTDSLLIKENAPEWDDESHSFIVPAILKKK